MNDFYHRVTEFTEFFLTQHKTQCPLCLCGEILGRDTAKVKIIEVICKKMPYSRLGQNL